MRHRRKLQAPGADVLPLRRLEIRRAAQEAPDRGGDALSEEGIEAAYQLGRSLRIGYTHLFSSGTQRATQTIACLLAGMGRHVLSGVAIRRDLGSPRTYDWRAATAAARGIDPSAQLEYDEAFLRAEGERLSAVVRSILANLPEGSYALAVTDDCLAECAVYGLTGKFPTALKECDGFLIAEMPGGRLEVERLRN